MFNDFEVKELTEDEKNQMLLLQQVESLESLEETKERYRKVTQAAITTFVKGLKDGQIEIKTVDEFEKLVKLDLYLQS